MSGATRGDVRRPGAAIASTLLDFGGVWGAGLPDFGAPALPMAPRPDPIEDLRRLAYDQGFAAGGAAEAETAARALADAKIEAAEALAAARIDWAETLAGRLEIALQECFARIETVLSAHVAAILAPFVEEAMTERMLDAFAEAVRQATGKAGSEGEPAIRYEISGPANLLEALRARLSGADLAFAFLVADQPDVSAIIDETRLATNIAAWLHPFRAAS